MTTEKEVTAQAILDQAAQVAGFANWQDLQSQLPAVAQEVAAIAVAGDSPQPDGQEATSQSQDLIEADTPPLWLENAEGEYDFAIHGNRGKAYASDFTPLLGTWERVYGHAELTSVKRDESDSLELDYEGSTEIDYNTQVTIYKNGERMWLSESMEEVAEPYVILMPRGFDGDFSTLRVRRALVNEYVDHLVLLKVTVDNFDEALQAAQKQSKFSLTEAEKTLVRNLWETR